MTTKDCGTTTSGTDWLWCLGRPEDAAREIDRLKHDLADTQCAAKLMSEAYDRMVLKYEKRISELEHQLRPFD